MADRGRVALEWRVSGLIRGTEPTNGFLGGVEVASIVWAGGEHPDGPWRIYTRNLPSRHRPRRDRYPSADEARDACEAFVARWLVRMVDAAGWRVR